MKNIKMKISTLLILLPTIALSAGYKIKSEKKDSIEDEKFVFIPALYSLSPTENTHFYHRMFFLEGDRDPNYHLQRKTTKAHYQKTIRRNDLDTED